MRRHRGRRPASRRHAQDLPAELWRVLRSPPVQRCRHRARQRDRPVRKPRSLRHRPDLRGRALAALQAACRDLRRRVGADPAFELRRARRRDRAGQPVGLEHHDRQVGLPASPGQPAVGALHRGLPVQLRRHRRVDHRPGLGRAGPHLRRRRDAGRERTVQQPVACHFGGCRSRTDVARAHAAKQLRHLGAEAPVGAAGLAHGPLRPSAAAAGAARIAARRRALSVRAGRCGHARRTLHGGLQYPGAVAGAAAGSGQHRETGDRRVGRARLDPCALGLRAGDGPAGPAAGQHPRLHHAGLRHQQPHAGAGARADGRHRLHGARDRHPAQLQADAGGPGPPVRPRHTAVRHHLRERAGRRAHQPSLPPRQFPQRHRRRHRRLERTRARLVHLRRRRPHVALQRERQRAEDPHQAPGALGRQHRHAGRGWQPGAARDRRDRGQPRTHPQRAGRTPSRASSAGLGTRRRTTGPEDRGHHRALRIAGLPPVLHASLRLPAEQGGLSRTVRVGRSRSRPLAGRPAGRAQPVLARRHQEASRHLPVALLQDQSVQALLRAELAQGRIGGLAFAAWRLAGAERFGSRSLAGRVAHRSGGVSAPAARRRCRRCRSCRPMTTSQGSQD
ncbi:hypothetical protein VARIO8X_120369 [Burkholderiales bacterium 8X]|nr:hypothetical protein VARIO8X_120369 [Burkholderiales bacterium 8X]